MAAGPFEFLTGTGTRSANRQPITSPPSAIVDPICLPLPPIVAASRYRVVTVGSSIIEPAAGTGRPLSVTTTGAQPLVTVNPTWSHR
jgi:hypothetical protein